MAGATSAKTAQRAVQLSGPRPDARKERWLVIRSKSAPGSEPFWEASAHDRQPLDVFERVEPKEEAVARQQFQTIQTTFVRRSSGSMLLQSVPRGRTLLRCLADGGQHGPFARR